jgi:hypothetical protein
MATDGRKEAPWKDVDQRFDVERPEGDSTTQAARRIIATGGAARYGGYDLQSKPPPENYVRGASNNVRFPAAFCIRRERAIMPYHAATHYR